MDPTFALWSNRHEKQNKGAIILYREGGATIFSRDQRGGGKIFSGVKEGGQIFFPRGGGANFFGAFGSIPYSLFCIGQEGGAEFFAACKRGARKN